MYGFTSKAQQAMTAQIHTPKNELSTAQDLRTAYEAFAVQAKSENTRKAYANALAKYEAFTGTNEVSKVGTLAFLTKQATDGAKVSTLKLYLAALASVNSEVRTKEVKLLIKGATRVRKNEGVSTKQAQALTVQGLTNVWSAAKAKERVLLGFGFFGALRSQELINLKTSDVRTVHGGLALDIQDAKTGSRTVFIPEIQGAVICPVRAYLEYSKGLSEGYVFPNRKGAKTRRPWVSETVKKLFGAQYSAHSLRAGGITAMSNAGASIAEISKQSGHRTTRVVLSYIRHNEASQGNGVTKLASSLA